MQNQTDRKVLLSLKDVEVKFNVRGRILTAIRRVSLDIYENEALAIVGESGSGKSVLTKTFAGMLESNGFISNGTIILSDDEISDTSVELNAANSRKLKQYQDMLNKHSVLERGAAEFRAIQEKKNEIQAAQALSLDEEADYAARLKRLKDNAVDKNNYLQTLDRRNAEDAKEIVKVKQQIAEFEAEREQLEAERKKILEERMAKYKSESGHAARDAEALKKLEAERAEKIAKADNPDNPNGLTDEVLARNERLAKELLLSTARYPWKKQLKFRRKLDKAFKIAMSTGADLNDPDVLGKIFDVAAFRVEYRSFDPGSELTLNKDGSYLFSVPTEEIEEQGSYRYEDGVLTLTDKSGRQITACRAEGADCPPLYPQHPPRLRHRRLRQGQVHRGLAEDPRHPNRNGLPGPHDLAEPGHHHRQADHVGHPQAPEVLARRGQSPHHRDHGQGRHPRPGEAL